jgi:hypothetical protein
VPELALGVRCLGVGLWRALAGGVLVGGALKLAAERVEAEDLFVLAREFAQVAVELIERVVGVAESGHLEVLRLWRVPGGVS